MSAEWPRERSAAAPRAVMKAVPEDFEVMELAGLELEGAGEHLHLRLRKVGCSTPEVARWLADCYHIPVSAVGYAGMKDKRAVTEQWFSVHTPAGAEVLPDCAGIEVCDARRHSRKLRRGQLAGNHFRVRLRDVVGDGWCERLGVVGQQGVPNYFGPQRFGSDNLTRARTWLAERRRRRESAFTSGLYLSVLRSFLFNEVLGLRVARGNWNRWVPGDVSAEIPPRCQDRGSAAAGSPSGPLWGRGRSPAAAEALEVERTALAPHAALCNGLEHAGLAQARRSLVLKPRELQWRAEGATVDVTFTLPPGGYATTLLAEVFDLTTPGAPA